MPYTLRKVKNKRCYSVSNKKGNKKSRCSTRKNAKKQVEIIANQLQTTGGQCDHQ